MKEAVRVIIAHETERAEPVRLTAAEAHEALYGPGADPRHSAAIWQAVLSAARADLTPHGDSRLLVIWLMLPRLTGTVHRVCRRLGADRCDVEAEMALALLEELTEPGNTTHSCAAPLAKAARVRAWRLARGGWREFPSTRVEHIARNCALTHEEESADASASQGGLDIRVDRPDGPDGPRASLRFRVRSEHLRADALAKGGDGTRGRVEGRCVRTRRARRRVGTLPIRPAMRRR
ncbi:hypothetical protein [Streptomyces sp. NPDC001985]|uniref:hypothetical protein n=1 Tax=Streptomyces sp. NPDC001985 TaxID=3154406 RepID=UPI00331CAABB